MQVETKIKEVTSGGGIAPTQVVDVDITGFSFTPTAILKVALAAWIYTSVPERGASVSSLLGSEGPPAYLRIIKLTPGTNKVIARLANKYADTHYYYYRITCTAARSG